MSVGGPGPLPWRRPNVEVQEIMNEAKNMETAISFCRCFLILWPFCGLYF